MKKLFGLVLALGLLVSIAQAADLKYVSEFEGGQLYKAGRINVVVMKGNFYQMGRQYGSLVKNEINEFYDLAAKQIGLGTDKAPYDEVLVEM